MAAPWVKHDTGARVRDLKDNFVEPSSGACVADLTDRGVKCGPGAPD